MPLAAAFASTASPRVVYQNTAHCFRTDRIEVCSTLPIDPALVDQTHESFVDQGRGLQRMTPTLGPKIPPGQLAELIVHERHELLSRVGGSLATRVNQNLGQIRGFAFHNVNVRSSREPFTVHELRLQFKAALSRC